MKGDDQGQLVERLVALGLDEREAKLYLHLALSGPRRASDAAAATRLKRTETYRALDVLMRRGFVTSHLAKPVVYEANPPDAVFSDLLARHDQRKGDIERLREEVTSAVIVARKSAESDSGKHAYKIIQGRRAILNHVEDMLRHAERNIAAASTNLGASGQSFQNRAWQTLVKRASEGIPSRILVRDTLGVGPHLAGLLEAPQTRLRIFDPGHNIRFAVVDERETLVWLVTDPSPSVEGREDVAMWTNAPDFVRAQVRLYEALWQEGRDAASAPGASGAATTRSS